MAYEMVMPYHLHMPSYFLETFTEYPYVDEAAGMLFGLDVNADEQIVKFPLELE